MESPEIKMVTELFNQGIPMVPFPNVERCLGLSTGESIMKFEEGYAIMAFDFEVSRSNTQCLFNMQETIKQKELRAAKRANMSPGDHITDLMNKLSSQALKEVQKQARNPNIDIAGMAKDLNLGPDTNLFEGIKKIGDKALADALKDPAKLAETVSQVQQTADQIKNIGDGLFKFF
jgi:hypothetical protein